MITRKVFLACLLAVGLIAFVAPPALSSDACLTVGMSAAAQGLPSTTTIVKQGGRILYRVDVKNCSTDVPYLDVLTRLNIPLNTMDDTTADEFCAPDAGNPQHFADCKQGYQGVDPTPGQGEGPPGGHQYQDHRVNVAPGDAWFFLRAVRVNTNAPVGTPVCNHAHATGGPIPLTEAGPTAEKCFGVVDKAADVSVSVSDSADPVPTGQPLTFVVAVSNGGPDPATGVALTDNTSGNFSFGGASPSQGSCAGSNPVSCSLGTIAGGAGATVTISVTPTSAGTITNTASASASQADPNPSNNSDTESTTVTPVADLSVSLSDAPDPVTVGSTLTYTATIASAGPDASTGVTLTDTLPAGVTFQSASTGCSFASGKVTCALGTLASGGSKMATITVTPASTGTITNSVSVSGGASDPNPGNNTASATTTVNPPPPLQVIVDVKEGAINVSKNGVIPVAIITTSSFNATTVNPSTVCFGESNPSQASERDCTEAHGTGHIIDVDGDLDLDLVLHYEVFETGIDAGDTRACLTGRTFAGSEIAGCDDITTTTGTT